MKRFLKALPTVLAGAASFLAVFNDAFVQSNLATVTLVLISVIAVTMVFCQSQIPKPFYFTGYVSSLVLFSPILLIDDSGVWIYPYVAIAVANAAIWLVPQIVPRVFESWEYQSMTFRVEANDETQAYDVTKQFTILNSQFGKSIRRLKEQIELETTIGRIDEQALRSVLSLNALERFNDGSTQTLRLQPHKDQTFHILLDGEQIVSSIRPGKRRTLEYRYGVPFDRVINPTQVGIFLRRKATRIHIGVQIPENDASMEVRRQGTEPQANPPLRDGRPSYANGLYRYTWEDLHTLPEKSEVIINWNWLERN